MSERGEGLCLKRGRGASESEWGGFVCLGGEGVSEVGYEGVCRSGEKVCRCGRSVSEGEKVCLRLGQMVSGSRRGV